MQGGDDGSLGQPELRLALTVTRAEIHTANFVKERGAKPASHLVIVLTGPGEPAPSIDKVFLRFETLKVPKPPHWDGTRRFLTLHLDPSLLPEVKEQIAKPNRVVNYLRYANGHVWADFIAHD